MTPNKAIREARKLARVISCGRHQHYTVNWSEKHNAWWQGNMGEYARAAATVRELRIGYALELLGVDDPFGEAYFLAWRHEGRWDQIVRIYWRDYLSPPSPAPATQP
jgi:hypothetical protein